MGTTDLDNYVKYQDVKQLEVLFKKLDINQDGKICCSDLICALEDHHGLKNKEILLHLAEEFLSRCGIERDGELDFDNFMKYVIEHDKRLIHTFTHLDYSKSGMVRTEDVVRAFHECGMPVGTEEAERLVSHVDQAENFHIDYGEWRDFLIFHSADDMSSILTYWRYRGCMGSAHELEEDYAVSDHVIVATRQSLQLISGAVAGAASRTLTAPIDRLKVMRQVHGYKHKGTEFMEAYRYMIQEGGWSSLWRGNGINVLKMAPETALKFASYEHYKRFLTGGGSHQINLGWISESLETRPQLTKFISGSLAGATAQTVIYPLEVLKTRMCLRKTGQYHSMWHCARSLYRDAGLPAFYRGYLVNLVGIIPYAGIELALYERLKSAYIHRFMLSETQDREHPRHLRPPMFAIPFMAAIASACGIVATYPISLVRAKLQATYYSQRTHQKVTASVLVSTILREDGFYGLYRGMWTSLMKVLPAVGISLATYETLRREFNLGPLGSG